MESRLTQTGSVSFSVVAQAAPFCFGPASTLLAVVDELERLGGAVSFLASGTALQLIRLTRPAATIIECDTDDERQVAMHTKRLRSADIVVSNTDLPFALWCIEHGCVTAVLDTLFWMWDQIDPRLATAEAYIVQDFEGVEAQKRRCPPFAVAPVVGPLIATQASPVRDSTRRDAILLSFGGVANPLVSESELGFPKAVVQTVLDAAGEIGYQGDVIVCGGGPLSRLRFDAVPRGVRLEVCCLGKDAHLELLRTCRVAIVSPGLTVFFEALRAETPVMFLPPQNYSQLLQLRRYREMGVAGNALSWDDMGWTGAVGDYVKESRAVDLVRGCVERYVEARDGRALFERVATFLRDGVDNHSDAYRAARDRFGHDGPAAAARLIAEAACDR